MIRPPKIYRIVSSMFLTVLYRSISVKTSTPKLRRGEPWQNETRSRPGCRLRHPETRSRPFRPQRPARQPEAELGGIRRAAPALQVVHATCSVGLGRRRRRQCESQSLSRERLPQSQSAAGRGRASAGPGRGRGESWPAVPKNIFPYLKTAPSVPRVAGPVTLAGSHSVPWHWQAVDSRDMGSKKKIC